MSDETTPGVRPATRMDFMRTLSNVKNMLIRATYNANTREAALQDISMDTAIAIDNGEQAAVEVEQCDCPLGYAGLSCEVY